MKEVYSLFKDIQPHLKQWYEETLNHQKIMELFAKNFNPGANMSGQDDKAKYFSKSNTKRGNKVSYVKNPISTPMKYNAGEKISIAGNTKGSKGSYGMNRNMASSKNR